MSTPKESVATNSTATKKEVQSKNLKFLRDRDREMVRGKFIFHEVPGGTMSFPFKAYKEDDVERYDMVDGQIYSIPLGVARHLNKNCWYPQHTYALDDNGRPMAKVGQKIRRCSFQSLEFVDVDDLTPEGSALLTVEKMANNIGI